MTCKIMSDYIRIAFSFPDIKLSCLRFIYALTAILLMCNRVVKAPAEELEEFRTFLLYFQIYFLTGL